MPPPIPERYRLEVRLGRDGDVEEWLGTDTSLDRPVLIRILGPDAPLERHHEFLNAVRAAAGVNHPHLAAVFTAGEVPGGTYSVSEWVGGMTLANRIASGDTISAEEFLPNAAGLALAVAALHEEGIVHGAIDAGAVFYAVAHPAKLGAFGRHKGDHTVSEDVRSLARTLEEALTGGPTGGPPPSELIDGLSPAVDQALHKAETGAMGARALGDALGSAPSPLPEQVEPPGWSKRLLLIAALLVAVSAALVGLGRLFLAGSNAPIILPSPEEGHAPVLPSSTTTTQVEDDSTRPTPQVLEVTSFDPYGGGDENDERLGNLVDGNLASTWRTETYRDPLPLLKPGVGVMFHTSGTPRLIEISGITPGAAYAIYWSAFAGDPLADRERIAWGTVPTASLTVQLPPRSGGYWLFWLQDLPQRGPEDHSAELAEVRFRP